MRTNIEEAIRAGGGVVRRRDHPELQYQLDRLRRAGQLVAVIPGILCPPELADDWQTRVLAGSLWAGPNAILTRFAAARLTFWTGCADDEVSFAVAKGGPRPRAGWPLMRATIPPELVIRTPNVAMTCPAYTAVELSCEVGGDVIDRALRSRMASLAQMWSALDAMPVRPGNAERRRLLDDSVDRPWSELERAGHRLLRKNRVAGWTTNSPVATATRTWQVDVLFAPQRLILEFDGYEFHSDRDAFELDRRRRNELELAGYLVLNFTWAQVHSDPEWVIDCVRRALRMQEQRRQNRRIRR